MEPLTESTVHSAITSVAGNLTYAAQLLGVTREEIIDFVARRPPLRELVEDIRNTMIDDAQALLRSAVVEQQPWALKLVLRTQGCRRGYGQRADPLETWKPPPEPEPVWERLSKEEFARMVEIHQDILKKQEQADAEATPALSRPTADQAPSTTPPSEDVVRTALVKFKGHLTNAAAELAMMRGALERHIERRPIFQALLANFRDELIDHAETGLRMALGQKAPWAIQLVLDTIGLKHGYSKGFLPAEDPNWLEPPDPCDWSVVTDAELNEYMHLINIAQGIEEPTVVPATAECVLPGE